MADLAETLSDALLDSLESRRDGRITPELTALCRVTAGFIVSCAAQGLASSAPALADEFSRNLKAAIRNG